MPSLGAQMMGVEWPFQKYPVTLSSGQGGSISHPQATLSSACVCPGPLRHHSKPRSGNASQEQPYPSLLFYLTPSERERSQQNPFGLKCVVWPSAAPGVSNPHLCLSSYCRALI